VGCGAIVHTSKKGDGRVINIEGDPDHVINRGTLCSKGAGLSGLIENENRLLEPMYRAPYANEWKQVSWDWALTEIAKRVKATRDASFERKNAKGQVVNRTTDIVSVGSEALLWIMKNAGFIRQCCVLLGLYMLNIRLVSDIAQLLRLWQSRSDVAQ